MKRFETPSRFQLLTMRFSGGGASGAPADPPADPPAVPASVPPAAPTAPAAPPAADPPAKTYTDADLAAAKAEALAEYQKHLEEAKDYDKMTPEEKVIYLEAQRETDKLTQMATAKLAAQELPVELLEFVRGKDEADTDAKLKIVKAIIDKATQVGVDKRFKDNGYLPKGSAVTTSPDGGQKRERGVKVQ